MLVCADADVPERGHDDSAAAALHTISHSGKPLHQLPHSWLMCSPLKRTSLESLVAWQALHVLCLMHDQERVAKIFCINQAT